MQTDQERIECSTKTTADLSVLTGDAFDFVYRQVYRTSSRAWVLWFIGSMGTIGYAERLRGEVSTCTFVVIVFLSVAYAGFISFWVTNPSRFLRFTLERHGNPVHYASLKSLFDDSWASVRDWGLPIVVTLIGLLAWPLIKLIDPLL